MGARALAALRMVWLWGVGGFYGGGIKWNHVGKLIAATTNVVHEEAAEGRVSVSI
jgi:hypothetical protein